MLRKLSEVVNVVPVIAKSDSLTLEERSAFKERVSLVSGFMASPDSSNRTSLIVSPVVYFLQIRAELQQHGIKLYPFDSEELDAEELQLNERIRVRPHLV